MFWIWITIGLVVFSIILCCTILYLFSKRSGAYVPEDISEVSQYRKTSEPIPLALNDPLARNKVYEKRRAEQLQNGVVKYNANDIQLNDEPRIVGLAEPQGFWTRFVMGQKLGYIKMRMSLQKEGGSFWTTLINAQAASQGKDQGRGR